MLTWALVFALTSIVKDVSKTGNGEMNVGDFGCILLFSIVGDVTIVLGTVYYLWQSC